MGVLVSFFIPQRVTMADEKTTLENLISNLKRERDELQLQMHLASMDAKDEYERLSGKCDELWNQFQPFRSAVGETAQNVCSALTLAADELWVGFKRVRKSVSDKAE